MKLITHCPTCGAPLTQAPTGKKVTCSYCGAVTQLTDDVEAQVYKAPASVPEPEPLKSTPPPTPIEVLQPTPEVEREEPARVVDAFETGHSGQGQSGGFDLKGTAKKLGGWLIGLLVLLLLVLVGCCVGAIYLFNQFGSALQ